VAALRFAVRLHGIACGHPREPSNPGYYRKLRDEGKKPKVAQVACMHKLLIILNAIAEKGTPWRLGSET
jgi:ketol-acid reductoisomerase